MNTPRSKKPLRFGQQLPKRRDTPDGRYSSGLWQDKLVSAVGQIATYWPHIEDAMIEILRDLLGGDPELPARQVFRSIISQQARIQVMTALLAKSRLNEHKSGVYDEIIAEFAALNKLRNTYVHGLWWTHESGKAFLSEEAIHDWNFLDGREVTYKEVEAVFTRMDKLHRRLNAQRTEGPRGRLRLSQETPPEPPLETSSSAGQSPDQQEPPPPPRSSQD